MCTPFTHNRFGNPADIGDNLRSNNCAYCNSPFKSADIENELWLVNEHQIRKAQGRIAAAHKEFNDPENCYLNLRTYTKEKGTK